MKLSLPLEERKRKDYRGRLIAKDTVLQLVRCKPPADVGHRTVSVEITDTEGESTDDARSAMEQHLAQCLGEAGPPIVMLDYCEPDTVWVGAQCPWNGLWGYAIYRGAEQYGLPRGSVREGGGCVRFQTRSQCEDALRAHWYNNGPEAVVRGIIGLCTDVREWTCPKCQSVQRREPPYRCEAPRCGHTMEVK